MKAAIFHGPRDIQLGNRPKPRIGDPAEAVVRVVASCVCGSDLWYYRGIKEHKIGTIGHEFMGVVEEVGAHAGSLSVGDFVVAPFKYCDGVCANCKNGYTAECVHGGSF